MKPNTILIPGIALIYICFISSAYSVNPTIIALPDTQFYSANNPAIFTNMTQWMVNNVATRNITMVIGLGDIVNVWDNTGQWDNANDSLSLLDGVVPYSLLCGNHDDNWGGHNYLYYNTYFNYTRYLGIYDWYQGNYPSTGNENSYSYFNISGDEWMVISLSFEPPDAVLSWANDTLIANSDKNVIVATHSYRFMNGTKSTEGQPIWYKFAKYHSNIRMILSGHHSTITDGDIYMVERGINNNTIHEFVLDYQQELYSGGGYNALFEFIDNNTVNVTSYSSYFDNYLTTNNVILTFNEDCTIPTEPATEDWVINTTCYIDTQNINISDYDINITLYGNLWLYNSNITFGSLNVYDITGTYVDVLTLDPLTDNYFDMSGL